MAVTNAVLLDASSPPDAADDEASDSADTGAPRALTGPADPPDPDSEPAGLSRG